MRVANPEDRVAVPVVSGEGVATASCIGAEFIKSLIDPGKVSLESAQRPSSREEGLPKIFLSVTVVRH